MQDFKHLQFWRRAHALAIELHKLARSFSRRGHGNLKVQLTKAAQSISTNIREGCGAATKKEFARFLDVSIKSANETEHHLLSARDFGLMPPSIWGKHTAETIEIRKMIFSYRQRVIASDRIGD